MQFPSKFLRQIYFALADSNLNYCITSWGNVSKSTLQPLIYLQNKMIRLIDKNPNITTLEKYKKLDILPLQQMYHYRLLCKYYFCPDYRITLQRNRTTRAAHTAEFIVKQVFTRYGERCRSHSVPKILNNLTLTQQNLTSYSEVKNKLRKYLLESMTTL